MFASPRIRTYLGTIYERRKVARDVLLGVFLLFGMFALWAWRYSASAIVQLTSSSAQQTRASAVDAARGALSDEQLAAIMEHLQLYPEMIERRGEASAIRYIRSRISLQANGQGENKTGEVRVTYLSSGRATAIKVANALAQSLTEVKQSAEDLLAVDTAATIERQLEDSRLKLTQLAVRQHKRAKNHARHTSRRRSSHRAGKKSSTSSTVARAYKIELDRYQALLRAQRSMKEYQDNRLGSPQPEFTLVQNATQAKVAGIATRPLYWLTSLLVGLFASTLSVLFAPRHKVTRNSQPTIAAIPTIAPLPPSYGTRVGFKDFTRSGISARATSGTSWQSDPAGGPADPAGPAD